MSERRSGALVGDTFSTSSGATRAVPINLTNQQVTVGAGATLPQGAPYQTVTGDPLAKVSDASKLTHHSATVSGTITLPQYSITYIR